jgi:hypothetical protein
LAKPFKWFNICLPDDVRKFLLITICVLIAIGIGGYLYTRFHVLKTKDFKPDKSKERNVTDLRPAIIAKLQQVVKDGSGGLYKLSIGEINPDVAASRVDVKDAVIDIDSTALKRMDDLKQLPDELFRIKFDSLRIDGFGIADLLDKKNMSINEIYVNNPVIETYHRSRSYNESGNHKGDSLTLYQRLAGNIKKISIGKISIEHGTFNNHNLDHKDNVTHLNNIRVRMENVLVDSSTQYDKSRYLFAKHTNIRAENYNVLTADKMYLFKAAVITVSGEQHRMIAQDVELEPYGGIKRYESKMPYRKTIYHIKVPRIELKNVHWWGMINRKEYKASEVEFVEPVVRAFTDYRLPPVLVKRNNYPQQLLMEVPSPVSVNKINLHKLKVIYEEYDTGVKKTTAAIIDNINGSILHISNVKEEIREHPAAVFTASGLFMNKVRTTGSISFNFKEYRTGKFTADFHMDTLDNTTVNPLSEPMVLFTVKRGQMQQGKIHITGNNFNANAKIAMYYNNLHVTPLKADSNSQGKLKKKHLRSFVANVFLIKNSNPAGGTLREPGLSLTRDLHGGFFKMIWQCTMGEIVKTVGLPVKMFYKNAK